MSAIAECFDKIRQMRKENENMVDNDDEALGDQFNDVLQAMIDSLTENLKRANSEAEKGRAVIQGKRDLMALLVDKSLEYLRVLDPTSEVVMQEIAAQYETMID